jgi:nitrite reductase/ring-hydroxylating ferredoxin subunit/uncharacterized membrane protein
MLVSFPFAYLFGSACLDAGARVMRKGTLSHTAGHMRAMGLGAAALAAVPGIIDYFGAVPPRSSARDRATRHALANISALTLFGAAHAAQRRNGAPPRWAVAAGTAGAGLLAFAGWLGGTLVYRNQIGVDHRYADAGKWQSATLPPPPQGGGWVDAGPVDALGVDQMKLLEIGERRVVLARTDAGLSAFSDRCTHKGGPLSDGALVCGVVQCPWHGSQFNVRSGAVTRGPAGEAIEVFQVREVSGRAEVYLPAVRHAPC